MNTSVQGIKVTDPDMEVPCQRNPLSIRRNLYLLGDQLLITERINRSVRNFQFLGMSENTKVIGIFTSEFSFQFENAILVNHEYSLKGVDFNRTRKISKVVVDFRNYLETTIIVHHRRRKD